MKLNQQIYLLCITLLVTFFTTACSSTNVNSDDDVIKNQTGTLRWGSSPAVDGVGMLFVVDEKEYGAPGTPEDYPEFFEDEVYEVNVLADFKLTGEDTVRGWGATFPAIEFIRIEKIERDS